METCYLLFIVMCLVYANAAVLTGKALYCRDPDTGKLHAVNSTWQSTTFCGNYSCKLRKLNKTETEYLPIRQINITNLQEERSVDLETSPTMIHTQIDNTIKDITGVNDEDAAGLDNNDRYLTETEIKSIADMLHTVKKSDLDAIVEIYKIAQDIYKEIDTSSIDISSETKIKEANTINDDKRFQNVKQNSYWYEPLHISAQKGRPVDLDRQETIFAPTTQKPDSSGYFNGILSSSDFAKLPYYYPMSSFQRTASYVHSPPERCDKVEHALIDKMLKKDSERTYAPISYPYPYIPYNNSFSNMYVNPWNYWDYYRNYPYAYIAQVPTNVEIPETPEVKEDNVLDNLLAKVKDTKLPEWKTDPLSPQVLEEVRANIEKSRLLKPFPLRKKVNLDRVGKLIKLDEFTRTKRSTEMNHNDYTYDVYLETVTCRSDTQPGYFRMGDQKQQYPDCCPQRIDNNDE